MSWRAQIILIVILLILGNWYYFYEIKGSPIRQKQEIELKRLFPGVDPARTSYLEFYRIADTGNSQVEIEHVGLKFSFKKHNSLWNIVEPVKTKADNNLIEDLISQIVNLKAVKQISTPDQSLEIYGLKNPAFIIDFLSTDSQSEEIGYSCKIGNENPTGEYLYVQSGNEKVVFLVANTLKTNLTNSLFGYRDKRIITFKPDDISKFTIERKGSPLISIRKQNEEWILTEPVDVKGDQSRINEILNILQTQKINEFVSETGENLSQYGLDDPYINLKIHLKDTDAVHHLFIGNPTTESCKFNFARKEGTPHVFSISKDIIEKLPNEAFDIRNKSICEFDRNDINKIILDYDSGRFELLKEENDDWKMVSPREFIADQPTVGSVLSNLSYLRATGIKDAESKFGEVYASIFLYASDNIEPELVLTIGGIPGDRVGRWVRTSKDQTIFRVSDDDIQKMIREEFDFRKKELISFNKDDLDRIKIDILDNTIVIEQYRDSWRVIQPEGSNISESTLQNIYWEVHRIRINSIVTGQKSDLSRYGLDIPQAAVTIYLENKTLGPLNFGKSTSDGSSVYACFDETDQVVTVDSAQIKDLLALKVYNSDQ